MLMEFSYFLLKAVHSNYILVEKSHEFWFKKSVNLVVKREREREKIKKTVFSFKLNKKIYFHFNQTLSKYVHNKRKNMVNKSRIILAAQKWFNGLPLATKM